MQSIRWVVGAYWLLVLSTAVSQAAAPSFDAVFPATTKGFVSTTDVQAMSKAWETTQFGQMASDPEMAPFMEDLRRQMREKWNQTYLRLGVTWEDIETVAGGESASALIWDTSTPEKKKALPVSAFLVDVTGKLKEAQALLARIDKDLKAQKAKPGVFADSGVNIAYYDQSPHKPHISGRYCYFLKDNVLCGCDDLEAARLMVRRLVAKSKDSLDQDTAYQAVLKRCQADAGSSVPHARWFAVPLDFIEARRRSRGVPAPASDNDNILLMRHQGFEGILGSGGFAHFEDESFDMLHRVAIYAPSKPPYWLAMNILDFPNAAPSAVPAWVPADVAVCGSLQWNIPAAFEASKTLFDEIYGVAPPRPGAPPRRNRPSPFEDTIYGMLNDPRGPKVDFRKEIIAHLGPQVQVLIDYTQPIETDSEDRLFAAKTDDPAKVLDAVKRLVLNNPETKKIQITAKPKPIIVYQIPEEDDAEDAPSLKQPVIELDAPGPKAQDQKGKPVAGQGQLLANSYVTVANNHLLVSSSLELMKKALRTHTAAQQMANDPDYQAVEKAIAAEAKKRGWKELCYRRFSRTEKEFEATYELTRQGKMPQSDMLLAKLLNSQRPESADEPRQQRIDGSKMPDYSVAERYLTPGGWLGVDETDGWFLVQFTLKKKAAIARKK